MAVLHPQDAFSQNTRRRFYDPASWDAAINGGRISSYKCRNAALVTASSLSTSSLLLISHKPMKKAPASVSQKWVRKAPRKNMEMIKYEDAFAGSTVEPNSLPLPGFCSTKMNGFDSLPSSASATIPKTTWNEMNQLQDDINKETELQHEEQQQDEALKKRENQRAAPPIA